MHRTRVVRRLTSSSFASPGSCFVTCSGGVYASASNVAGFEASAQPGSASRIGARRSVHSSTPLAPTLALPSSASYPKYRKSTLKCYAGSSALSITYSSIHRNLFSTSTSTLGEGRPFTPPPPTTLPLTVKGILELDLTSPSSSSPSPSSSTSTPEPTQTTDQEGPRVQLNGWVKSIRKQKRVAFAVITDGSTERSVQAVFVGEEGVGLAKALTNGCCVRLSGVVKESIGPGQDREFLVDGVQYLGGCDPEEYPIAKKSLTVEYLRDHCHLRARTSHIAATLRLRDQTQRAFGRFFEKEEFTYVHTPLITANDCEGAGDTFSIAPSPSPSPAPSSPSPTSTSTNPESEKVEQRHFFNRPAYLTVSSQLHLEAIASSISRVWTLSPCFRAERSQTGRHLAEFWMLEAEWAFVDSVDGVCDVVERAVKDVLGGVGVLGMRETLDVLRKHSGLYEDQGGKEGLGRLMMLEEAARMDRGWERMSYSEAVRELRKYHLEAGQGKFKFEPVWGASLQSEHERWLAERLVGGPVFVTDYPAALKPFYMRSNSAGTVKADPHAEGETVACFDLLVPYLGELVGGSVREERLSELQKSLERHGLDEKEFEWYLDLRRFGSAPHGGFGLGVDRLVQWMSGIENIRECVPMPRYVGRMLVS